MYAVSDDHDEDGAREASAESVIVDCTVMATAVVIVVSTVVVVRAIAGSEDMVFAE